MNSCLKLEVLQRTGSESLHQTLRFLHDLGLFLPNPSYRTRAALVPRADGRAGLYSLSLLPSLTACLSPKRFKTLRLSTWPS